MSQVDKMDRQIAYKGSSFSRTEMRDLDFLRDFSKILEVTPLF